MLAVVQRHTGATVAADFDPTVTPEMLAAGREELASYSRDHGDADDTVYSIFIAMWHVWKKATEVESYAP
jgi:hypothetical protein